MRLPVIKTLLFLSFVYSHLHAQEDQCYVCHAALEDKPSQLYQRDIHFLRGISCSSCHGGDSRSDDMEKAMNRANGFMGVPKNEKITEVCAVCHANAERMKRYNSKLPTNQLDQLKQSVHGKLAVNGKGAILQCTACHNVHGIVSSKDPASPVYPLNVPKTCSKCHGDASYMRQYNPGLPVDQYEKYRTSFHGKLNARGDSRAAECVSCHGGHSIKSASDVQSTVYPVNLPATCAGCHSNAVYMAKYNIPTDQFDKFSSSVHGIALLKKKDISAPSCNDCHGNHGAAPPGVESVSKVCGTCHTLNSELFSASPHKSAFDKLGYPECETCHGNHSILTAQDKLLGITDGAVCLKCHKENENPKGYRSAKQMRKLLDSLNRFEASAAALVNEAEQKGMEIAEAKFKLQDIRQVKMEARTKVHSFSLPEFQGVIQKGFTTAADVSGQAHAAIDEYSFRRVGLFISVCVISFLALILYLFIKRIEKQQANN